MQHPVGMAFNPDLMRNEMVNFWEVLFSPIAMNKFLHVVSTSYMYAAAFIIMVSCYYLLKNREKDFAKKSILVAATF
jgi:cytochrome d ubiquinol oxidase subunit I